MPKRMSILLRSRLPEHTWNTRLVCEGTAAFLEFDAKDVDRLARLGIDVDHLGPQLVVCMWDEASPLEIGGYLVVDNLAMGVPPWGCPHATRGHASHGLQPGARHDAEERRRRSAIWRWQSGYCRRSGA